MKNVKSLSYLLNTEQKRSYFLLSILLFISSILEILVLTFVLEILNFLSESTDIKDSKFSFIFEKLNISNIFFGEYLLLFFGLIFFLKTFASIFIIKFNSELTNRVRAELSLNLFKLYMKTPIIFKIKSNTSNLMKKVTIDVDFAVAALNALSFILLEILLFLAIAVFLLIYNFKVSIILLLLFIFYGFLIDIFNKKKIKKIGEDRVFHTEKRIQNIIEALTGFKELKMFDKTNKFIDKFKFHNKKLEEIGVNSTFRNSLPKPLFELLVVFLILLSAIYFGLGNYSFKEIVPVLGIFLASAYRLIPSLSRFSSQLQRFQLNIHSVDHLNRDRDRIRLLVDEKENHEAIKDFKFKKSLDFKNIYFSFNKRKHSKNLIFDNAELIINKGEKIGIIGESGVGKTTFIDLICGLHSPDKGEILIDGNRITEIKKSWQKKIGFVPQDTFILDDTLKKNIAFGEDEKMIDDVKIDEVIKTANLTAIVKNLDLGINTNLGERGKKLSGGQKQRVAIARALYFDPEIIIFDESTNSLDAYNESKIMSEILEMKDKTIIFVSHKKDIFKDFNLVYKIENKKLKKTYGK